MDFKNLELIKQYDNIISNKEPVRLCKSKEGNTLPFRYHLGFPERIISPLCPLLETTVYWGETHWREEDGFWIWQTPLTGKNEDIPYNNLNRELSWRIGAANQALRFLKKGLV